MGEGQTAKAATGASTRTTLPKLKHAAARLFQSRTVRRGLRMSKIHRQLTQDKKRLLSPLFRVALRHACALRRKLFQSPYYTILRLQH